MSDLPDEELIGVIITGTEWGFQPEVRVSIT